MSTTYYAQPLTMDEQTDDSSLYYDPAMSPTAALFPPELSAPFSDALLNLPLGEFAGMSGHNARLSVSSYSDGTSMSNQDHTLSSMSLQPSYSGSASSRPPSLSPSSQAQSIHPMSVSAHSPSMRSRSSVSPSSNFSLSATDDFLLPSSFNTFTASELDMLFLQDPSGYDGQSQSQSQSQSDPMNYGESKPGQSLFLPGYRSSSGSYNADLTSADFLQNIFNTGPLSGGTGPHAPARDDTFDMLNLVNASPIPVEKRREQTTSMSTSTPYTFPNIDYTAMNARQTYQPPTHSIPPQWMTQQPIIDQKIMPNKNEAWPIDMVNDLGNKQTSVPSQQPYANNGARVDPFVVGQSSFGNIGAKVAPRSASPTKSRAAAAHPRPAPARTSSAQKLAQNDSAAAAPMVGKHNKTERRYRQKVQAAQADLRDSIPALRVLYGTSTEDQKRTTDFRAVDGTVDGLGEVTRPNASAKATILIAARVYIELLQKRSTMLQRKVQDLEQFRLAVAGEDNLRNWREQFDAKERELQAIADLNVKLEDGSSDEEDEAEEEEEEEEPKRKRPRTAAAPKAPRAKPGPKGKKTPASNKDEGDQAGAGAGGAGAGLRVFAAFAMSFSLVPSASNLLKHAPATEVGSTYQIFSGSATTGQVLARLPLITAEHTSRLLASRLPSALVPSGHTLVDWTWRLLVAVLLAVSMGPIIARLTRENREEKAKAGTVSSIVRDCATIVTSRGAKGQSDRDSVDWDRTAAGIVGGTGPSSLMAKWHTILHLNATAKSAYSLALLALLQPEAPLLRSPEQVWHEAHSKLTPTSPPALVAVLQLPLHEALRCVEMLPPTSAPIAAIAEQISLVHIYDLYSRFFIRLVDASTKSQAVKSSTSLVSLLSNLESCNLRSNFQSSAFDKEIRSIVEGIPKSSTAHALGLVLIGLWGIFTGPTPGAQAALAAALAAEEFKASSSGLGSISAMLELLYPGSTKNISTLDRQTMSHRLPPNANAVDKLALACIDYIRLLTSASELNNDSKTRLQRLEASQNVQKATSRLRLVLTQTNFVGMDEEHLHDHESDCECDCEFDESERDSEDAKSGSGEGGLESETRKFERAKERLVDVLCQVGRRAAGRAAGRDEDSGMDGDLDEL